LIVMVKCDGSNVIRYYCGFRGNEPAMPWGYASVLRECDLRE
jgi:hypothetical protein